MSATDRTAQAAGAERRRQERVAAAIANPIIFTHIYMRPYNPSWPNDSALARFGQEMLAFMRMARRGVVMLPPEFMKTTLGSQAYPLWLTARYTASRALLRGLLLSEEEDMAVGNLAVVKWHIEHNDLLASDFRDENGHPLLYPDPDERKWSEDEIIVNRPGTTRDPTWKAKGLDSKGKQGRRLDHIIGDDVVTPGNAWSPTMRKRGLDTWELEIETRLVEKGQALILGNFNDVKDILSTLERRPDYATFKRPSLHLPGRPERSANDAAIDARRSGDAEACVEQWPEVWHFDRLMGERDAKPQRFRRIHLLDSRAERGDKLKIDWMALIEPDETPLRYCRFYIMCDPAPGGDTEDLDYFTITVVAAHEQHLDIVESFAVRCDTPRQCQLVGLMHDRWQRIGHGVIAVGVPGWALDSYFKGALSISRADLTHKVEKVVQPGNKLDRLEGLGPYAQTGWLRCWARAWDLRTSDAGDQHQEMTLREEWKDFPGGRHDDRLDGVDGGIRLAREFNVMGDQEFDIEVMA